MTRESDLPDREARRRQRLARALRDNLKRRKQQIRGREAIPPARPDESGLREKDGA